MAFETIPTPEPEEVLYPDLLAYTVVGTFLVIVLILSIFQNPVHTWWKNIEDRRIASETVQLPIPLVAQNVILPTPGVTPFPTPASYVPVALPSTQSKPVAKTSQNKLPKTGPGEDVFIYLISSAFLSIIPVEHIFQKRKLKRSIQSLEVLKQ